MNRVNQFITARRMSLGLILLLAGLMYVSTLIPQEIDSAPGEIETWRLAHQGLLWLVDSLSLHRLYAQPWFAAVILFAALALGISTWDQLAQARKKLKATAIGGSTEVADSVSAEHLRVVAGTYRYHFLQTGSQEQLKFVRNPWGYFGSVLLHFGMTLVIITALYVSLTGRQGALILVEGELSSQQQWHASEQGLLAEPLRLPGAIVLEKATVTFNSKNQPAEVSSHISITDGSGRSDSLTASINRSPRYRGLRIYHASQYGNAFTVAFTEKNGTTHTEKILVQQPTDLTTAGYSEDFGVTWSPYLFSAKYYADAARTSMLSSNPQLTLRVLDGKKERARTTLTPGSSGMLGDYRLQLLGVERWAKLILVDIRGMAAIFTGFAIIMLGGLIHYLTPSRELVAIRQGDESYRAYWKAAAFSEFFREERDHLAAALNREADP